ncbi:MAG: redoxin domain-containing protein [Alistipes sp.]|nr:redoxin domain-containing protein [Candidatus Minthomonas equi]
MKKLVLILLAAGISFMSMAQQETVPEQTQMSREDVNFILGTFDGSMVKDIIPKAEMLINTAKSPEQMAFLAEAAYDFYHDSKIMGYDEIAVYIADSFILNGKVKLPDGDKYMLIKLYADANRLSLIGLPAQELNLPDMQGKDVSLRNSRGDYKLLMFYEDECPVCRRQIPRLMDYLSTYNGKKMTFYRVYTQSDRDKWISWVADMEKNYKLSPRITVVDVWDPEFKSDFIHKYGVISTPQLFLISRDNIILGRGLTPNAVGQVMEIVDQYPDRYESVFAPVFQPLVRVAEPDMTKITDAIDIFFNDSKDNPDFFHESMFSLFQYLKKQENYNLQKGAVYLAEKYIVNMPSMWEGVSFVDEGQTEGSSLLADYSTVKEFLDATAESVRRFKLNPLGEKISDIPLTTSDNGKFGFMQTGSSYTILYFYSSGCAVCDAAGEVMKTLAREYADDDVEFVAVYTGNDKNWPSTVTEVTPKWTEVWDRKGKSGMSRKFDLDGLPRIYILDKQHNVFGKDLNPDTVKAVLNALFPKEEVK